MRSLRIRLPDRKLTADIDAKSLRKGQAEVREAGADAIALVLQGSLIAGDIVAEAGLGAQPKTMRPAEHSRWRRWPRDYHSDNMAHRPSVRVGGVFVG